jgi:hypothetical protein
VPRRRSWDSLSGPYRRRLERAGITSSDYASGRSLQRARGHRPQEHARTRWARDHRELILALPNGSAIWEQWRAGASSQTILAYSRLTRAAIDVWLKTPRPPAGSKAAAQPLPVADDLRAALDNVPGGELVPAWYHGSRRVLEDWDMVDQLDDQADELGGD